MTDKLNFNVHSDFETSVDKYFFDTFRAQNCLCVSFFMVQVIRRKQAVHIDQKVRKKNSKYANYSQRQVNLVGTFIICDTMDFYP